MRPAEITLRRHSVNNESAPGKADDLLGDFSALIEQLGSSDSPLAFLASDLSLAPQTDLKIFLERYQAQFLRPLDFPVIARAHAHAMRGEARELIALDQQLNAEPSFAPFAAASRRVGRAQMARLRPLRDSRVVQRYLVAIENGQAQGWHTIAYGLTLAVYSLPLRQGLVHYGIETLSSFSGAMARSRKLMSRESDPILEEVLTTLPASIEETVARTNIFRVEV